MTTTIATAVSNAAVVFRSIVEQGTDRAVSELPAKAAHAAYSRGDSRYRPWEARQTRHRERGSKLPSRRQTDGQTKQRRQASALDPVGPRRTDEWTNSAS